MEQYLYLKVDYADKEKAKKLGCKWDALTKRWYAPNEMVKAKWLKNSNFRDKDL